MIYTKTTIMNCNGKMVIGGREIDARVAKLKSMVTAFSLTAYPLNSSRERNALFSKLR